jgi:hypothetical protein
MVSMNYLEANPFYARNMWSRCGEELIFHGIVLEIKCCFNDRYKIIYIFVFKNWGSWERLGPLPIPMGTTSQTYIWTETISEIQEKIFVIRFIKQTRSSC